MIGSLQNLRFGPVDWVIVRPCMLGYGGFIGETPCASVFMLLQTCLQPARFVPPMYTLPQVHGTSKTTFDCFVVGRGSLPLVRMPWRVGPDFMVIVNKNMQDTSMTNRAVHNCKMSRGRR